MLSIVKELKNCMDGALFVGGEEVPKGKCDVHRGVRCVYIGNREISKMGHKCNVYFQLLPYSIRGCSRIKILHPDVYLRRESNYFLSRTACLYAHVHGKAPVVAVLRRTSKQHVYPFFQGAQKCVNLFRS